MGLYSKIIDIQKLNDAANRVKRNKPAAGVDGITYEQFEGMQKAEIKQLNIELRNHTYKVMPVKLVKMVQGDKLREISLYSMRDKVVQTSIAMELVRMYDASFTARTYAYRNSKSAMQAANEIEKAVLSGQYAYVCKTDISSFFDNIDLTILRAKLAKRIKEEDALDLIFAQLTTPSVSGDGDLTDKKRGLYQGSAISPVLSNVYMADFDYQINLEGIFFARYADDMVLMSPDMDNLQRVFGKIKTLLEGLRLSINEKKTYLRSIEEGFEFLGYAFSRTGKSTPKKAENNLQSRLEDVWFAMNGATLEEKLKKGSQILNGWEQYYRGSRQIANIYEYVTVVYMMKDEQSLERLEQKRASYINRHKEIARYLASIWKYRRLPILELFEYEQFFLPEGMARLRKDVAANYYNEMIAIYSDMMDCINEENLTALMQAYSDLRLYDCAEAIADMITKLREKPGLPVNVTSGNVDCDDPTFDAQTLELFETILVGREDMYVREELTAEHNRKSWFVPEPLTKDVLRQHLRGKETIGTHIVRNNDTVHYVVIDVDISKRYLLRGLHEDEFAEKLQQAADYTVTVLRTLRGIGISAYAEFSGYRGYHIWTFFTEWIPIRYAFSLLDIYRDKLSDAPEEITVEMFPSRGKKKTGNVGQTIKLPFGIHLFSGKRSYFCDEHMLPVADINEYLGSLAKYSIENIKRTIGANIKEVTSVQTKGIGKVDFDYDALGNLDSSVSEVLHGCNLMQYLVNKAMRTGYLSHFERLSILHVFGHVGEAGKEFVHAVMAYTLNYKYNVTQRFIDKIPEKPVSCIKLREQYKQITAEYGCSCTFKRTRNCYPSPVIHAIRGNSDENHDITIPTSRTLSEEKKETVYDELNVHVKVRELAKNIAELKKQKRGIEKSIHKVEHELEIVFDNAKIDSMEIDIGTLIRRKSPDGKIEWIIEI